MKLMLAALLLASPAFAGSPLFDGGGPSALPASASASTITIPSGTGTKCFSADDPTMVVNCVTHAVSVGGAGGLSVGGTVNFDALTLNSGKNLGWQFTTGQGGSRRWEARLDLAVYGDWALRTESSQGGGFDTTRFYINNVGDIGMGTTSPTTALSVYGVVTSSTTQGTTSAGTISATCTDQHCTLTPGAVTSVTYTFGTAWPNNVPDCVALTNASVPLALSVTAVSKTALTITSASALTGDTVTFICMGAP